MLVFLSLYTVYMLSSPSPRCWSSYPYIQCICCALPHPDVSLPILIYSVYVVLSLTQMLVFLSLYTVYMLSSPSPRCWSSYPYIQCICCPLPHSDVSLPIHIYSVYVVLSLTQMLVFLSLYTVYMLSSPSPRCWSSYPYIQCICSPLPHPDVSLPILIYSVYVVHSLTQMLVFLSLYTVYMLSSPSPRC